MNKIFFLILVIIMIFCTSSCEKINKVSDELNDNKATIITNEGKTVHVTAEDMFAQYDYDKNEFQKMYKGASIRFKGTVKNIKVNTSVYTGDYIAGGQNKIIFEEGWCLIIGSENTSCDLTTYTPGQKLEVSTGIVTAEFDSQFLQGAADNNRVVWLVGNDEIFKDVINKQNTTITLN